MRHMALVMGILLAGCLPAGSDDDDDDTPRPDATATADGGGGGTDGPVGGDGGGATIDAAGGLAPMYQSGTRMRMRFGVTPDGAKEFRGWHDLTLGIDCAFTVASDGVNRCLPWPALWAGVYYANSSCTTPVAYSYGACGAVPAHARLSDTCGETTVYPVLGAYSGTLYVKGGDGACYSSTPATGYAYYSLGPAVAPSTYQSSTETIE